MYQKLFTLRDEKYAEFQAKLTPGIPSHTFIGVRVPTLRKFAKEIIKSPESKTFLHTLPHSYYDENMLHALLISEQKDYDHCIELTEQFLPYVDNWAVCDIMSPKVFTKHKAELMPKIKAWSQSPHTYTCRFGLEMLMSHFLDKDFLPDYLQIPVTYPPLFANGREQDYYVRMMVAWFFATALAKQWESTIGIIESKVLPPWTHNKTIQKARESFRIKPEQKEYLKTLKI